MNRTERQERVNTLYTEKITLQSRLNDSDYKVIKCAEAQIIGVKLPYEADQLHKERQQLRDRINYLEDEIASLEAVEPEESEVEIPTEV